MRDALTGLDREGERLRHLRRPLLENRLLRQPIKRVVDLDRVETRGVVLEPMCIDGVSSLDIWVYKHLASA
jgi:hypothetical protein